MQRKIFGGERGNNGNCAGKKVHQQEDDRTAMYVLGALLCVAMCQGQNMKFKELHGRVLKEAKVIEEEDKLYYDSGIDKVSGFSTARQQFVANGANVRFRKKAILGFISTQFTKQIMRWKKRKRFSPAFLDVNITRFTRGRFSACSNKRLKCKGQKKSYRTADGSCNNLHDPAWGQSDLPFKRLLPPDYADDVGEPRKAKSGLELPNARRISNLLFAAANEGSREDITDPSSTLWLMTFGQFMDHDIARTPIIPGKDNSSIDCCASKGNKKRLRTCFPVIVSPNDPYFGPLNVRCLNLVRSAPADLCPPTRREQSNAVTSFIDASHVYGSSLEEMNNLRLFEGGKLKTSPGIVPGKETELPLLPQGPRNHCVTVQPQHFCHLAGDTRSNEVPTLTTIHTAFLRDHNRMSTALAKVHPKWNDEMLFQTARKITGAVIQHLTYAEFLPLVVGQDVMRTYGLLESSSAFNNVYDRKVDPTVANSFATASYRFGHSLITNFQNRMHKDLSLESRHLLDETFNNPTFAQQGTNVDGYSSWMSAEAAGKFDRVFSFAIRNRLFFDKATNQSLDLPAMNLQRGRDHGLPGYNRYRELCGLTAFDRSRIHIDKGARADRSLEIAQKLADIYESEDDIELFVGGVTEKALPGAAVGPLFACLIAKQFRDLKLGDRYWFENRSRFNKVGFTAEQVLSIKRYSFAKVICKSHQIDRIQGNLFKQTDEKGNPVVFCADLPDIDFRLF